MSELTQWDSFYGIVGSAAGSLIGLQFVVLTLIAQKPPAHGAQAGAAFSTPTIVHFCTTLLVSALLRAPLPGIGIAGVLWGLIGTIGIIYVVVVAKRMHRHPGYRPEFEDWLCHVALPLAAYTALAVSAIAAAWFAREALFGVGGAVLVLLFASIHNAWDAVSYHVFVRKYETLPERSTNETSETS